MSPDGPHPPDWQNTKCTGGLCSRDKTVCLPTSSLHPAHVAVGGHNSQAAGLHLPGCREPGQLSRCPGERAGPRWTGLPAVGSLDQIGLGNMKRRIYAAENKAEVVKETQRSRGSAGEFTLYLQQKYKKHSPAYRTGPRRGYVALWRRQQPVQHRGTRVLPIAALQYL